MYADCHAHACLYNSGCEDRNNCLVLVAFDVCEVAFYHRMSALLCLVMVVSAFALYGKRASSCMADVSVHALLALVALVVLGLSRLPLLMLVVVDVHLHWFL